MDLFDHRYYRLSKTLMLLVGQWPYQRPSVKRGILAVIFILIGGELVPQILAVLRYRDNEKMLVQCLILYILGAIAVMKLFSFMVHSQKVNQIWSGQYKFYKPFINLSMLRIVATYSAFFVIMTAPLVPTTVDILMKNDTACKEFPYPIVYYNIDEQKYYFQLIMYTILCAYVMMTIIISNDVILIVYVHHVCGIFAALGHKLKRIGCDDASVNAGGKSHKLTEKYMVQLAACVDRHNSAIEYANLIEASYTRVLFLTTTFFVILLNVTGLQILIGTSDPTTFSRFVCFELTTIYYLYIEFYFSQVLTDHSISIRFHIYNSQWYTLSPAAQKIVQFMMMRCNIPCQLTAGKMMILSVRTFWLTIKTSISFFGFLRSTQSL